MRTMLQVVAAHGMATAVVWLRKGVMTAWEIPLSSVSMVTGKMLFPAVLLIIAMEDLVLVKVDVA